MGKFLFFTVLSILGASISYSNTCPLRPPVAERVKWVLAEASRINNMHYQKCLKGENSPENVAKFIDCKENTKECRENKDPGYCDNFCVEDKDEEKNKNEEKIGPVATPTPKTSLLRCDGGIVNNGGGKCESNLNIDPKIINFLSFNLFWWNAVELHGGNEIFGSIKKRMLPADLLALQECSDVRRVLNSVGLSCYGSFDAGHAVALAWNPEKFEKLSSNRVMVGLDQGYDRWNANRVLGFVRLKVKATGQTIFFANIHGVLGVNSGGIPIKNNCEYLSHGNDRGLKDAYIARNKVKGDDQTFAQNIVDVIKANIQPGDILMLAGDFNIDKDHRSENPLKNAFERVTAEWVDKIFIQKEDKDKLKIDVNPFFHATGSDHRAIRITFGL